jgi:hypothetical protein
MALINLTVDLTDPAHPKVVSEGVLNFFPGDRLQFQSNPPGIPIAVKLDVTLLALVRDAALNLTPNDFGVHYAPGSSTAILRLIPPGDGQGARPDPPS